MRFQPEVGAAMKARLAAETDRILGANRRAGTREPVDRYRADALAAAVLGRDPETVPVARGGGRSRHGSRRNGDYQTPDTGTRATRAAGTDAASPAAGSRSPDPAREPRELVLVVDLAALRRGCLRLGETCTIRGVGPVPVEVARSWVDDAFVKAVIRNGTDIRTIHHLGRHIPARLRTALDLVEPICAVPRCDNPRLEYHHLHPHAELGGVSAKNLARPCELCHDKITHEGYRLTGPPAGRLWVNPDDVIERADDPTRVGHHAPPDDPHPPSRDPGLDTGIELDQIDVVDGFDQLVLTEPARAP